MIPRGYPIRRFVRTGGFGAITAAVLPALLAHQAVVPGACREAVREQWIGTWSSALLSIFGVRVIVRRAMSAGTRGRLVVANHRSAADIPVLLREFGGRMVSRADLAHWALVGPGAPAVETVFVARADPASGAAALRAIRSHLAEGATITVFPEGTTFHDDDVRPFQVGPFAAALRAQADVVAGGRNGAGGRVWRRVLLRASRAHGQRGAVPGRSVCRTTDGERRKDWRGRV